MTVAKAEARFQGGGAALSMGRREPQQQQPQADAAGRRINSVRVLVPGASPTSERSHSSSTVCANSQLHVEDVFVALAAQWR